MRANYNRKNHQQIVELTKSSKDGNDQVVHVKHVQLVIISIYTKIL